MRRNITTYALFAFAGIMILIIVAIAFISTGDKKIPTDALPTPTTTEEANSTTQDESGRMLLNKLNNRQPLSQSDLAAKSKIVSLLPLNQVAGVVHETKNVRIEFVNSMNLFTVEVLTEDISLARNEAVSWFLSQGLSRDAICNYPVQFYLNYEISQSLKNSNLIFSPLADGC